MERYCSFVGASVKSRRYPYANIARRLRDVAQLKIIRELYDLHDIVQFGQARTSAEECEILSADQLPDCRSSQCALAVYANIFLDPGRLLLTPSSIPLTVTTQIRNKIIKYLVTAFCVPAATSKQFIPPTLKQWGRMRITGGGDLIQARGYHKLRMDGRDASFVRVRSCFVPINIIGLFIFTLSSTSS
jgi:hypothetical protein